MNERCRICGTTPALRFGLYRRIGQGSSSTTRGCGRTFLCETCWRRLIDGSPRKGGLPEK